MWLVTPHVSFWAGPAGSSASAYGGVVGGNVVALDEVVWSVNLYIGTWCCVYGL